MDYRWLKMVLMKLKDEEVGEEIKEVLREMLIKEVVNWLRS